MSDFFHVLSDNKSKNLDHVTEISWNVYVNDFDNPPSTILYFENDKREPTNEDNTDIPGQYIIFDYADRVALAKHLDYPIKQIKDK